MTAMILTLIKIIQIKYIALFVQLFFTNSCGILVVSLCVFFSEFVNICGG